MNRLVACITRIAAALVLIAALVAIPVAVVAIVSGSDGLSFADLTNGGRIGTDAIVSVGVVVFAVLWAWFATTTLGEVGRVLTWRARPTVALAPVVASPTGAIRRLVRIALISTTMVGSSVAAMAGPGGARHVLAAPAAGYSAGYSGDVGVSDEGSMSTTVGGIRSNGRDTPYSIAVRLGDPTLRQRIIDLNQGTYDPGGAVWNGGVFPTGMIVAVPAGFAERRESTWTPYSVEAGDSVYRIASRLAGGDNRRVRDLADAIIERNLGRVMGDGVVFDDPSLVRVGWQLEVPTESAGPVSASHIVLDGESYWSVANDHLDTGIDDPQPAEVASLTKALIDHNAPRFGRSQPTLIHPGDELHFVESDHDVVALPAVEQIPIAVESSAAPMPGPFAAPPGGPVAAEPGPIRLDPTPTEPPPMLVEPVRVEPVLAERRGVPAVEAGDDGRDAARRSPVTTSIAAAVLLCAGALGLVESRRRQQLRRAVAGSRLPIPTTREVATERLVRSLDAPQRAVRLDLALRSAGHWLVGSGGFILGAIIDDEGSVQVMLDRAGRQPGGEWARQANASRWLLTADTTNEQLAATARLAGQPCPAIVHLGAVVIDDGVPASGQLFIDLEAFGLMCIDGVAPQRDQVVNAIAASLAASPVGETMRVITHGLDPRVHLGNSNAETARDLDDALDLAASALGSTATATATNGRRTAELRARGLGGEAWEPVVVVSAATDYAADVLVELLDVTRGGGRGLAVVLCQAVEGASLTMRATATGWELERLGLTVVPVGLEPVQIADVCDLIESADRPALKPASIHESAILESAWAMPAHALMVRVMGTVDVVDDSGEPVQFDRGKSIELAVWLSQHRDRATRSGARTALWELDVRDATFANVVSDARRSLARAVTPAEGTEWIARTLTEQLPLHPLVVSDADLVRACVDAARGLAPGDAIALLRPGVELLRGLPFTGTAYLWPDAEGITSSLTMLATTAATELARHHLALGDVDGVFWATGQGLKVLAGHEELIGLRMRAHARAGDLASVRSEWEGYERAITCDQWSDGEPSPKLLAIRRELLSS